MAEYSQFSVLAFSHHGSRVGRPDGFRLASSPIRHAMRTFLSLHSLCIALCSLALARVRAQHDAAQADEPEPVAPLVLPEVKAMPAYSFRGPFPEAAKIGGFEVTGQA